jgi:diglucosylglycerate octanoyltransferase
MAVEEKWKANQQKVAFMKQFPGLATTWEQVQGKTLEAVVPLPGKAGAAILIFSDGAFMVVPPLAPEPWELTEGLKAARPLLQAKHPAAYAEYDRLAKIDREALRAARMEKIIGAIQNNLEQIPELKDRLRRLVDGWK